MESSLRIYLVEDGSGIAVGPCVWLLWGRPLLRSRQSHESSLGATLRLGNCLRRFNRGSVAIYSAISAAGFLFWTVRSTQAANALARCNKGSVLRPYRALFVGQACRRAVSIAYALAKRPNNPTVRLPSNARGIHARPRSCIRFRTRASCSGASQAIRSAPTEIIGPRTDPSLAACSFCRCICFSVAEFIHDAHMTIVLT